MNLPEELLHAFRLEKTEHPLRVGLGIGQVERRIAIAVDPDDDEVQVACLLRTTKRDGDLHGAALNAVAAQRDDLEPVLPLDELDPEEMLLGAASLVTFPAASRGRSFPFW